MIGRVAIVALAVGLAGCAGLEPAGRNARSTGPVATATAPQQTAPQQTAALPPPQRAPAPTPQPSQTPQPAPQLAVPPAAQRQQPAPVAAPPTPAPAPQRTAPTTPPVAAPNVTVTPPAPAQETATPARARSPDEDIVVPGQVTTQVRPPAGDPRTNESAALTSARGISASCKCRARSIAIRCGRSSRRRKNIAPAHLACPTARRCRSPGEAGANQRGQRRLASAPEIRRTPRSV